MFVSLREKFNNVQEGITASLRSFSDSAPRNAAAPSRSGDVIRYNAGANILHKYQSEWSEMHATAETNALKAQELDELIGAIDRDVEGQWTSVGQMGVSLVAVPQLLNSVQELMEQVGQLRQLCDDVELGLLRLEDTVETQELQERQLDHRFQLAMYKEKKLAGLESLRSGLVKDHSNKLLRHELRQQQLSRERHETFGEAFKQDVQQYKQSGNIPRLGESSRGPSLEEVELDADDSSILDKFLQEDT